MLNTNIHRLLSFILSILAMKKGKIPMMKKLIQLGCDLSLQDNDLNTPLHDCLQKVRLFQVYPVLRLIMKMTYVFRSGL